MNSPGSNQNVLCPLNGAGEGFVAANWKSIFENAGWRTLEEFFSISGNALSKPGLGKRYRAQLNLKDEGETHSVFYKRYAGESWNNFFRRWWEDGTKHAIACREVQVAHALEKIEIATFKPLAWGWTKSWGINQKSFVVMSQVPGESIERWLPRQQFDPTAESWRNKIRLVQQLAIFSKRIHDHGWFHRDYYLCHIFITEKVGEFQLALVDLARMFRPRWRIERWQIKDLAQLDFSTPRNYFSRTTRLRFAKLYLGVNRLSPAQKIWVRKIAKRSDEMTRREARKKLAPS